MARSARSLITRQRRSIVDQNGIPEEPEVPPGTVVLGRQPDEAAPAPQPAQQ
jgi:hypothetical protein